MNNTSTDAAHFKWTYKEYICFILIYASYEDLDFSDAEEQFIRDRTGAETLDKMHTIFKAAGQYECLQIILDLKDKFIGNETQKEDLLTILSQHFGVDGEFSKLEKVLMGFLRNLL